MPSAPTLVVSPDYQLLPPIMSPEALAENVAHVLAAGRAPWRGLALFIREG